MSFALGDRHRPISHELQRYGSSGHRASPGTEEAETLQSAVIPAITRHGQSIHTHTRRDSEFRAEFLGELQAARAAVAQASRL